MRDDPAPSSDIAPELIEIASELGLAPAMVAAVTARLRTSTTLTRPTEGTRSTEGTTPAARQRPAEAEPGDAPRYRIDERLGEGGMGVVWRAHDRLLSRTVAMKVARAPGEGDFLAEARIAADLQHPGILPVYESGTRSDGRRWLTMREINGRRLSDLLSADSTHAPAAALRRLVAVFARVCEAVAFAHARGVVHGDLKPGNIMVGVFGEVIVLDWGAARRIDETATSSAIVGTRAYMPPERLAGAPLTPSSDVFALGCVLARILAAASDAPDDALRGLAERCRATEPGSRPADAESVAAIIADWLDGARRRAEALHLVEQARALQTQVAALAAEAEAAELRADERLRDLATYAPVEEKAAGWAEEDAARALRQKGAATRVDVEQRLQAALIRAPDLAEAREALASSYRKRVLDAEASRDPDALIEAEARLAAMGDTRHEAFLHGGGQLTLITDQPGAHVWSAPYVTAHRRLVPGEARYLGRTPLLDVPMARGGHRLRIEHAGYHPVIHAIYLERGEHWTGAPPDVSQGGDPAALPLPLGSLVPPEACYVPPGWCYCGGDRSAPDGIPRRRIWIDGFFIERDPLTYAALIDGLNQMVDAGRHKLAATIAPPPADRHGGGSSGDLSVEVGPDGHYRLERREAPGPVGQWPVNQISWHGAVAWARWRKETTGLPWRLPHDLEREKAARGADGRFFPWGDFFDPTWANVLGNRPGKPRRTAVGTPLGDVSPYGVRGLAGNVRDWCINGYRRRGPPPSERRLTVGPLPDDAEPLRMIRGGGYGVKADASRAAGRYAVGPDKRMFQVGVRLVCPFPSDPAQIAES